MNQQAIRILVVDDEPAIRRALRPPLLELGFQVAEASRGEEALQQLRAGKFDVVLLDINMPGIGGMETLRRIRAFAPRLPVLMLTVRDQEHDKVEVFMLLRGRQRAHGDLALVQMSDFAKRFDEVAKVERGPQRAGPGRITMLLTPK